MNYNLKVKILKGEKWHGGRTLKYDTPIEILPIFEKV